MLYGGLDPVNIISGSSVVHKPLEVPSPLYAPLFIVAVIIMKYIFACSQCLLTRNMFLRRELKPEIRSSPAARLQESPMV